MNSVNYEILQGGGYTENSHVGVRQCIDNYWKKSLDKILIKYKFKISI